MHCPAVFSSLLVAIVLLFGQGTASSLPVVDLGYAVHQATINVSSPRSFLLAELDKYQASDTPYYNFSNIRYGQAPVGSLRFAPPLPPYGRNNSINDGQQTVVPTQANPGQ